MSAASTPASMKFCFLLVVTASAFTSPLDQSQGYQALSQQLLQQAPQLNLDQQQGVSPLSSLIGGQQFPSQLPQQFLQVPQVANPSMGGFSTGIAADSQAGQNVNVQDVLGLVDSMGEQQRRAKALQAQLLQARSQREQLSEMVLAQNYRSNALDQGAKLLAQQVQQSMQLQKDKVDDLKKDVAKFKAKAEEASVHLVEEESSNQRLKSELSQARQMLTDHLRQEKDLQTKVATANRRAHEAEVRELNALKAGELEDLALRQQEELLKQMKRANGGDSGYSQRGDEISSQRGVAYSPDNYDSVQSMSSSVGAIDHSDALLQAPMAETPAKDQDSVSRSGGTNDHSDALPQAPTAETTDKEEHPLLFKLPRLGRFLGRA